MLGKLVSISTNFNIEVPPSDNFRFKKVLSGGGALRDLGTHMIDLLRFFGGEIADITGYVDNVVYKSEVDDFTNAIVKFKKSGYGYFNVSFNTRKAFNRVEILGYKGALSIENLIGRKSKACKLTIDLEGEAKKAFRRRANKLTYLLKSIQKSFLKNEPPLITGNDGLINMKIKFWSVNIYLFDEWAADQDPVFRKFFYRELLPKMKEDGKMVIAITHDDHYFDAADKILKLDLGKMEFLKTE